ncbi:MAG: carbohydrate transporter permease [Eubacterium sp.]|nr:carbohydrate transporter permease [Eubacterium sp.]
MKKNRLGLIILEILLLVFGFIFMYPIILMIINSIKPFREVVMDVIALPTQFAYENYTYVVKYINYPRLFLNNFLITSISIAGIVLFSSMAGYMLSRHKTRFTKFAYLFCIVPMLIPFQTIMITLLKVAKTLNLSESIMGLSVQYWGFGIPMAVFIFSGFVSTIPREIDESAYIDGASTLRTFFNIIFPLLKSISATVIALDVMWIWNDFLLPLLMVNGSQKTKTLTLAAYTFVGQYNTQWHYTMTAMVLAVFPSILFFIFMQKYIIKGVVSGAVKG